MQAIVGSGIIPLYTKYSTPSFFKASNNGSREPLLINPAVVTTSALVLPSFFTTFGNLRILFLPLIKLGLFIFATLINVLTNLCLNLVIFSIIVPFHCVLF